MNPSNLERAIGSGALVGLVGDSVLAPLFASAEWRAVAVAFLGALGGALANALAKVLGALGDRAAEKIRGRRRKAATVEQAHFAAMALDQPSLGVAGEQPADGFHGEVEVVADFRAGHRQDEGIR